MDRDRGLLAGTLIHSPVIEDKINVEDGLKKKRHDTVLIFVLFAQMQFLFSSFIS